MPESLTFTGFDSVRLEGILTIIAIVLALVFPRLGDGWFRVVIRMFRRLARRSALSVLVVVMLALGVRAAMLPWVPIPVPGIDDEYSYLLAGDTYAHGRLANPTHPMWRHFETIHVSQVPTYASMYPPAQGLVLAAGERLGHPWIGVWLCVGAMCGAICWMLMAWLPAPWALLGGLLAVLRIATFSYWMNSYWGGATAALAGALVLGALPRIRRHARVRDALLLGLGLATLANSRPYEGLLVATPVAVVLVTWLTSKRRLAWHVTLPRVVLPLAIACGVIAVAMAYFNWRVFGSPSTLPYEINRAQYAVAPYFAWQPLRPAPTYRYEALRQFYLGWELDMYRQIHSVPGFLLTAWKKIEIVGRFFFAAALLAPMVMLPWALRDRRIRLLVWIGVVVAAGVVGEVWFEAHYVAPVAVIAYALLLQCLRHLRTLTWSGNPVGAALVRFLVAVCVLSFGIRVAGRTLDVHQTSVRWTWDSSYSGNRDRANVLTQLRDAGGLHLIIVRYDATHNVHQEWVHNLADIDHEPVVWARDAGEPGNVELIEYFKTRHVWLLETAGTSFTLRPYPRSERSPANLVPDIGRQ